LRYACSPKAMQRTQTELASQLSKWMKSCNGRSILLLSPAAARWNNLDSHIRLDTGTTLESLNGVQQIS